MSGLAPCSVLHLERLDNDDLRWVLNMRVAEGQLVQDGSYHLYRQECGVREGDGRWLVRSDAVLNDFAWIRNTTAARIGDVKVITLHHRNREVGNLYAGEVILAIQSSL